MLNLKNEQLYKYLFMWTRYLFMWIYICFCDTQIHCKWDLAKSIRLCKISSTAYRLELYYVQFFAYSFTWSLMRTPFWAGYLTPNTPDARVLVTLLFIIAPFYWLWQPLVWDLHKSLLHTEVGVWVLFGWLAELLGKQKRENRTILYGPLFLLPIQFLPLKSQ